MKYGATVPFYRSRKTRSTGALVVVVTGASSGIGHATALAFAADGWHLVLAGRDAATLSQVTRACAAAGAATARFMLTDVTDPAQVEQLATIAVENHSKIDVWVNGVGVGAVGRFDQTPLEAHRRVIEANLLGHMHGAYAALRHFRARRRGTLINMISIGGWIPAPFAAAYTASKFGLRGLSEALRAEVAELPDVHVCDVAPTVVDSPGLSHGANYTGRDIQINLPLIDPKRVAQAVLALATKPRPITWLGSAALPGRLAHAIAPGLVSATMHRVTQWALHRSARVETSDGNLFKPSQVTTIYGRHDAGAAGSIDAPPRSARHSRTAWVLGFGAVGLLSAFLWERRAGEGTQQR